MKLYYYQSPSGLKNFGDDLNPWLFKSLHPNLFTENKNDNNYLIGIGTIINDEINLNGTKVVFSSGVGYGHGLPIIDESWKIYCVRGPLSAQKLGLKKELGLIDGAMLVTEVFKPKNVKQWKYSYMPHVTMAEESSPQLKQLCEDLNICYIDPRDSIEQILSTIDSTECLITEAMHGAIVSEALRVPWIPVVSNNNILSFKWMDWCASIGLDYRPTKILPLWKSDKSVSTFNKTKSFIKYKLLKGQIKKIMDGSGYIHQGDDANIYSLTTRLKETLSEIEECYRFSI